MIADANKGQVMHERELRVNCRGGFSFQVGCKAFNAPLNIHLVDQMKLPLYENPTIWIAE